MENKQRCVIIGGAPIGDYDAIKGYIHEGDFIIACDCGLRHLDRLEVTPDLIIGDFDSAENPMLDIETIVLPHVKDDTDTAYAVKEAVKRGFDNLLILGGVGGRFDHSLGNVYLLYNLYLQGKHAMLVDDFSEMEIVGREKKYVGPEYPYFSLLNISGKSAGIHISGAFYNLQGYEILPETQLGLSNEPAAGETAAVSVEDGCLLLIRDRI